MSYSLYDTFSDLVVTRDDMYEAELLAQKLLEAEYPTIDLRDGSPLRDIVIRPTATLIALCGKAVEKHLRDNRIDGITDSTPTSTVDSILSNFFVKRKVGNKARVLVRVKYAASLPTDSVTLTPSSTFSVDNINKYVPIGTNYLVKNAEGGLQYYTSVGESYWYADILCDSQAEGTQYNISGGTEFLYFSVFDPYFIGATALSLVTKSVETETNTALVARAPEAISTRNLINKISIPAQLNAEFNYLNDIVVSGMGDYEMMRDYRTIPVPPSGVVTPFHIGGYVDVYLKTELVERVVQVKTNSAGEVLITGVDPIVRIRLPAPGESSTSTIYGTAKETGSDAVLSDYEGFVYTDSNYAPGGFFHEAETGYSSMQNIRIYRAAPMTPNKCFDIKVLQWDNVSSVQTFLDDVTKRVVCANYAARGMPVVSVDMTLYIRGTAPGDGTLETACASAVQKYMDTIAPGGRFLVSEAIVKAMESAAGYDFSNTADVSYSLYNGKLSSIVPTGVPNSRGIIDSEVVASTPGHAESGSIKVAQTYVFKVNSVTIIGE